MDFFDEDEAMPEWTRLERLCCWFCAAVLVVSIAALAYNHFAGA